MAQYLMTHSPLEVLQSLGEGEAEVGLPPRRKGHLGSQSLCKWRQKPEKELTSGMVPQRPCRQRWFV